MKAPQENAPLRSTFPRGPRGYTGVLGAPGVGLGRIRWVGTGAPPSGPSAAASPADLTAAFDTVAARLRERADALRAGGHTEPAEIVATMALIADDPDLRGSATAELAAGRDPAGAVTAAASTYAELLAALPDPTLAARAADVRQVGRRVAGVLRGDPESTVDGPVILAGHELGADDLLDVVDDLAGAVSQLGGPNAHVAIVARALGVPLAFGVTPDAADGVPAVLDGATLILAPTPAQEHAAREALRAAERRRADLAAGRTLPAVTRDGEAVTLLANVATAEESRAAVSAGAEGAGLVRTELPFLTAPGWPDEAAHAAALRPVLGPLAGLVATVRTLDFAPDKLPPFLEAGVARLRAATTTVDERRGRHSGRSYPGQPPPEALAAQLAAIVATGAGTRLRVMLPMVGSAAQVREARALLPEDVPLGAMVETEAAVKAVDEIAAAADFLSIGTNDLTASLLGLGRQDPALTPARAAEPSVLRAIAATVAAGERHGRPVSVCGDAAADPYAIPLLIGVGCRILSVAPSALDTVRAQVRSLDAGECAAMAAALLG
ncbi:putative PEP-binding protein [Phytohabitans sp. ZYX-F-186]|uniref:Phosphoenolpyruvate-protein phosphotransferase n=1 Tax=Phytohabitans maris TaxID=3071409 RepID=A0ABU0ZE15_9ACTN|nr:putative PEP-binding protein [Phytohabitans sp. ZYX-F-186]MDQ7904592.1 putative PEP-binding protein [Phytohabitans sp. ZYX-F-186]